MMSWRESVKNELRRVEEQAHKRCDRDVEMIFKICACQQRKGARIEGRILWQTLGKYGELICSCLATVHFHSGTTSQRDSPLHSHSIPYATSIPFHSIPHATVHYAILDICKSWNSRLASGERWTQLSGHSSFLFCGLSEPQLASTHFLSAAA